MGDESDKKNPGADDVLAAASASAAPKKSERAEKASALFHVVGPGSIMLNGAHLRAGEEFTADAKVVAESVNGLIESGVVASGPAPKAPGPVDGRKAGRYRWVGPGALSLDRKVFQYGDVVDLDEKQARRLGHSVAEV